MLLAGHNTAVHPLLKNGKVVVAVTEPLKPGLHAHPAGTLTPLLLVGQATLQVLI